MGKIHVPSVKDCASEMNENEGAAEKCESKIRGLDAPQPPLLGPPEMRSARYTYGHVRVNQIGGLGLYVWQQSL